MTTRHRTHVVDEAGLERLLTPRDDLVAEREAPEEGDGVFTLVEGPFRAYRRTVEVLPPAPGHGPEADGAEINVRETFEFHIEAGLWRPVVAPLLVRGLLRRRAPGTTPIWAPPQRPDVRGTQALVVLATLALVIGYHGTLLGQTMTFAAEEFGADEAQQGLVLAAARFGGGLTVILGALADRRGRRLLMIFSLLGCIGTTALGAVTPNLLGLAVTQSLNRGTWGAALLLLGVIAAEEMPAGARAYALGLLTMSTAVGAGLALVLLPLADLGTQAWRLLYAAPLAMVPLVIHYGRKLPESRRYARQHRRLSLRGHLRYLVMICAAIFLLNMFLGPAPQFRNEFLRDERAFTALGLSLFVTLTSVPGSLGILVGGRLAETVGRRNVAAVSAVAGTALVAVSFLVRGPAMWLSATVGTMGLAALAPSFSVYNSELFPTSLRGRAAGVISMVAMAGSVLGLVAAGVLADLFGTFGPAMAILAVGPLAMAAIVRVGYPETAFRELEELNPEDDMAVEGAAPAPAVPPVVP